MMRFTHRILATTLGVLVLAGLHVASELLFGALSTGMLLATNTVGTTPGIAGNVNEAMKIIFEEPLTNSIVSDSQLLDIFEQDMGVQVNATTGGRYIELAHYFQLPAGVGARTLEGDYIPVPHGPVIRNSQIYLKKIEGVVQMSGDTMRRVRQGEGAFLTWARRALPDLQTRVDHELDRMLLGYGAGIRARVLTAAPGGVTTIVVDRNSGVTGLGESWLNFMEGESLKFSPNPDGSAPRAGVVQVDDVDPNTDTLTFDVATDAGVAQDDYIFGGDAAGTSAQNAGVDREIMGLLGMVDDGSILATFQGLPRSQYRPWRSQIFDGSAAPFNGNLTEDLLTLADDQTMIRASGEATHILMSRSGARNFWSNLKSDKRLNDPQNFMGGKGALEMIFGTDRVVELRTIRKMPDSLVYMLQKDSFKHWRNTGWEWDDLTGSIWNRVTDATGRKDSFYAVGHIVLQTGNIAPHKNAKITGIATIN